MRSGDARKLGVSHYADEPARWARVLSVKENRRVERIATRRRPDDPVMPESVDYSNFPIRLRVLANRSKCVTPPGPTTSRTIRSVSSDPWEKICGMVDGRSSTPPPTIVGGDHGSSTLSRCDCQICEVPLRLDQK